MRDRSLSAWPKWVRHHAASILVATTAIVLASVLGATRLELRSGLRELLPTSDPHMAALDKFERRIGDLSTLIVEIESPDPERNRAFAERLSKQLMQSPRLIERAIWSAPEVFDFFRQHRWLYVELDRLRQVEARIRFEILRAKNPLYVDLDEPPTLDQIESRVRSQRPAFAALDRWPSGRFETSNGNLVALVVLPSRANGPVSDTSVDATVRAALRTLRADAAGVTVRLGGQVHTSVEEHRAIAGDMVTTSILVSLLVATVVGLYFGRLRAIPLIALPALTGLLVTMGIAGVMFGRLNASTAFLGAIILGNGINYPILALARYSEERVLGRSVDTAIDQAICKTARATSLAAFAAAAAYGSLALTRFRGFSQFGVLGAIGMVLCWVATTTVLPAALWLLERTAPVPARVRRLNFGVPFARAVENHPRSWLVFSILVSIASFAVLPHWLHDPFEYDFRKLRTTNIRNEDDQLLDELFGRSLSPTVLLAQDTASAEAAATQLRRLASEVRRSPVAQVVTINDLLPGDPTTQQAKIETLERITHLLEDRALRVLSAEKRKRVDEWRPPSGLRPITLNDLPELAKRPFRERDGTLGRVVLIYPPQHGFSMSNGHDLIRLARLLRRLEVARGDLAITGRAVIFAAMIQSIAHDGPIATLFSFVAVALLTLALLRRLRGAAPILATLVLGVLWMVGVAAILNVKVNFLNFIALPITFGIGVDYAANIFLRYRTDGQGTIANTLRSTGGAVVLNSMTTILGYGSLLIAHNRALVSFGALAILGEFACLSAALLVMPALLALRDRRHARSP